MNSTTSIDDKNRLSKLKSIICSKSFYTAPASTKYHNYFAGGLLFHSLMVSLIMLKIKDTFNIFCTNVNCLICGFLHDLTKIDEYIYDKNQNKFIRSPMASYKWLDHAEKPLKLIELSGIELSLEESIAIKNHMGPFGIDAGVLYNDFSHYPLSFIMHMADVIDSKNLDNSKILMDYIKMNESGIDNVIVPTVNPEIIPF